MSLDNFEKREDRNFQNKCKYLLMQIKFKDKDRWQELDQEFRNDISEDETWDFSKKLVEVYNELN